MNAISLTDQVALELEPEPDMYMNLQTGSVDTLDAWHPYGLDNGLVLVVRGAEGDWVEA